MPILLKIHDRNFISVAHFPRNNCFLTLLKRFSHSWHNAIFQNTYWSFKPCIAFNHKNNRESISIGISRGWYRQVPSLSLKRRDGSRNFQTQRRGERRVCTFTAQSVRVCEEHNILLKTRNGLQPPLNPSLKRNNTQISYKSYGW